MNNDFHQSTTIFELFDGIAVKDIDRPVEVPSTNGEHKDDKTNGVQHVEADQTKVEGTAKAPKAVAVPAS